MAEIKKVICSQCGDYGVYGEDDTPTDVIKKTGFTWGIYQEAESQSGEPEKYDKVTENMIWLCPECGVDKDRAEGC